MTDNDCLEKLMEERDRRYTERFEAQEKALGLALASSRGMIATVISILALLLALVGMFWRK